MDNRFFRTATIESWRYWGFSLSLFAMNYLPLISKPLSESLGNWIGIIYALPIVLLLEFATSRKYAHPKKGFALLDNIKTNPKENWLLFSIPLIFVIGAFALKNSILNRFFISCLLSFIFFFLYRKKP